MSSLLSRQIVVHLPKGIHARVAAKIVDMTGTSQAWITYKGQHASTQSILEILALCIPVKAIIEVTGSQDLINEIERCLSQPESTEIKEASSRP